MLLELTMMVNCYALPRHIVVVIRTIVTGPYSGRKGQKPSRMYLHHYLEPEAHISHLRKRCRTSETALRSTSLRLWI